MYLIQKTVLSIGLILSTLALGNTPIEEVYTPVIDKIVITKIDTKGWDPLGAYGEPFVELIQDGKVLVKSKVFGKDFKQNTYTYAVPFTKLGKGTITVLVKDDDEVRNDIKATLPITITEEQAVYPISNGNDITAKVYVKWVRLDTPPATVVGKVISKIGNSL